MLGWLQAVQGKGLEQSTGQTKLWASPESQMPGGKGRQQQGTLTSKTRRVQPWGGFWTLFPDNSMTLQTQSRSEHSTWLTERSSDPISTTIPAVFITSEMKIHLLPKGLAAIKRLEYFDTNDHSLNWRLTAPRGHGSYVFITVISREPRTSMPLFPWGPRQRAEGNPPGTSLVQTQQPQEIFANVALEKKRVEKIQEFKSYKNFGRIRELL